MAITGLLYIDDTRRFAAPRSPVPGMESPVSHDPAMPHAHPPSNLRRVRKQTESECRHMLRLCDRTPTLMYAARDVPH